MQIVNVAPGSELFTEFLQLPWRIYPGRHPWLAPSKQSTLEELSPHNPFFSHGEAQAVVCLEGGSVVGRVVASVDDRRIDAPGVGHFGYFECIESDPVARALLESAASWLRGRGRYRAEGPIDLNIWTRYRVQVSGFNFAPYVGEPRSPPYYARLLEGCGYRERMRWLSYDFDRAELESISEFFARQRAIRCELREPSTGLWRVPWRPGGVALADLHAVLMESWTQNYGFSYIEPQEFAGTLALLARILDPAQCFFFRDTTRICAFGLGHLDRPTPQARPERAIIKAYGIIPEHRRTHLVYEILRDLTWHAHAVARLPGVLSLAAQGRDLWRRFKSPTRVHAVYWRDLTAGG